MHISDELIVNQIHHIALVVGIKQHEQVIPTDKVILYPSAHIATRNLRMIHTEPLQANAEEPTLALALSDVSQIGKALDSIYRALLIRFGEEKQYIALRARTISAA